MAEYEASNSVASYPVVKFYGLSVVVCMLFIDLIAIAHLRKAFVHFDKRKFCHFSSIRYAVGDPRRFRVRVFGRALIVEPYSNIRSANIHGRRVLLGFSRSRANDK
jgi:hypothetical protein